MEKKIIFTPVEPNKNLLWLHYKNGLLVLQRFGSKGWEDITNSDQITEAEVRELTKDKANLVGGKVPAEELPSYVDDVIEFNNIQVADAEISSIIGNNLYKNQIRFVNNSTTLPDRIGSEDKYPNMFVNFGENTSEDDWTTFEPEEGKIYVNTTNNHSYRWSGSYLIDLDSNWSQGIKDLQENTIRTDTSQDFSTERENQALSNIGSGLFVVDLIDGKATLTADQEAKLLSSSGVILRGTVNAGKEVLTKIYFADYQEGDQVSFWAVRNNNYILQCIYTKSTKLFQFLTSKTYIDPNAVSIKSQTLSTAQQTQALANLGMKVYVTDSSFLGSTLSAEEIEQVAASKVLLFTDTGDLFLLGTLDSNRITFTRSVSNSIIAILSITRSTGVVSALNSYNFQDALSLHFTVQNPALTSAQQSQAFKNLGWKVHVISESAIGSSDAVSDDEKEARLAATALLVQETGEMYIYGHNSSSTPSDRCFYRFRNTKTLALLNVVTTTGLITQPLFVDIYDENAVSFNIDQSRVSNDKKNKALGNIGIDFVRLPYSLLGTTLSDEMANVINNARGIILVDTPNDFILPTIYNKGRTTSSNAKFITIGETKDVYYILYNKNTKALANVVHTYTDSGYVRYVQEQNLTNTEKDTVLSNIGLDFVQVDYSLLGTTLTDAQAQSIVNSRGIILTNVPENSVIPTVYLKGLNDNNYCYFLTINSNTVISQISFNKGTKALSNSLNTDLHFDSVRYNVSQDLTDVQKQQARTNIGVKSADELLEDVDFIAQLKTKLETV